MLRGLGSVLAGMVLAVLLAGTVMAAPPEVIVKNESFGDTIVFTDLCPGLEIEAVLDARRSRTIYYDSEGNPLRLTIHVTYNLTFTNLANGVSLRTPGSRNITIGLQDDSFRESGVYRAVVAPGVGIVVHDSGHFVEDENGIFTAGPKDGDATEAFCAVLAD